MIRQTHIRHNVILLTHCGLSPRWRELQAFNDTNLSNYEPLEVQPSRPGERLMNAVHIYILLSQRMMLVMH